MKQYYNSHQIVMRNNYYAIYLPSHPKAFDDGMVYVHVLEAEKKLGRHITCEVVHHANKNKTDNSPENLWIFASNADHSLYHNCLRYGSNYRLTCIDNIYRCELLESNVICPRCGKPKDRHAALCITCRNKDIRTYVKYDENQCLTVRPSRDELKQMIRTLSFIEIGKKYNISDNAVRRWCKSYGLPYKKSIIKNITSSNWENI